jgi:hypothetical protein
MSTIAIFKGVLNHGIGCCCISPDGKYAVANSLDDDNTLAIYDIDLHIENKKNPKSKDDGLIASGKSTKAFIF